MSAYRRQLQEFSLKRSDLVVDLSDFDFGDIIGKGGFGEVKRGINKKTGRECAVKTIFAKRLEGSHLRRYISEIETLASCKNMFLVPFVGFTPTPPYTIVTEFMPNGALDRYVRRRPGVRPLSGTQLTAIAIGIADGMRHIHSKGIIHRDLKAANIMLDSRFFPRIIDFGIARFEGGDRGLTVKIGTPNYMAPELIQSSNYDGKVDVYAYAMILYEMSENQRPFRNMQVNDVFSAVVQRDKRPEFTHATGSAMRKLITQCWDRDPNVRPTFDEIFEIFASGKVAFPGTHKYDISNFLKIIEKSKEADNSNNDYSTSDSDYYKLPAHRKDPELESLSYSYSYSSSSTVTPPKPKPKPKPAVRIAESESSDSDDPTRVLCDPQSPNFTKYIQYYANTITPSQFSLFYSPISVHLQRHPKFATATLLLNAFVKMMKRNKQFISMFEKEDLFISLPVSEMYADVNVELYSFLFTETPKLLTSSHCDTITRLLISRPEKMLTLYSFYVKTFYTLNNPWPIVDNLFSVSHNLFGSQFGYIYLSLFHYLITNYEIYAKARKINVRTIFINFINSRDVRTAKAAYDGLCILFDNFSGIDFTRAANNLKNGALTNSILSLFMRVDHIPPSETLVKNLMSKVKTNNKAWIVMLKIADTKDGAEFLLTHTDWIQYYYDYPVDILRIIIAIFKQKQFRKRVVELPLFCNVMKAALLENPRHMQPIISMLIRRFDPEIDVLEKLSSSGFLKTYIELTAEFESTMLYKSSLSTLDFLSRIGYNSEFQLAVQPLIKLLSSEENAADAITVIVSLSSYQECCIAFCENNLIPYFTNLKNYEKYKDAAESFLKNVSNFNLN